VRALKLLSAFVFWRWTPCFALIGSSLLYVLIVVLVTPKTLSFGGTPKAVNVIEGPAPTNATPPADRGGASPRRSPPAQPASPALPPPAPATPAPPPPPTPAEEPRREAPPPPPPAPAPAPAQPDDEEEPAPPPAVHQPNPNARFMAAPLRFIPPLPSAAGAGAGAAAPAEER